MNEVHQIGSVWLGVIVPSGIFIFSFIVTYLLYRHFARELEK